MFNELETYKSNDHFFFTSTEELSNVCNAPKDGAGIYLVYSLKQGRIELIYIGSSGKVLQDGRLDIDQGGIYDNIVNGNQFEDKQKRCWKTAMILDEIEALDIYWYETIDKTHFDIPSFVKGTIIQRYFELFSKLPKWNTEY